MWFWRRKARERELEQELQAHLDLEAEEQVAAGIPADEARYAAKRALGNRSAIQESVRETWGGAAWDSFLQDLRYAVRSLRASPAFFAVAVLSLGLGVGANTAIFSFVNALLLSRLPVPEPTRLVEVAEYDGAKPIDTAFSLPFLDRLDQRAPVFDGILGRFPVSVNLTGNGIAQPLRGEVVTGGYFRALQVQPALGRLLQQQDIDAAAGNPVCVISYAAWRDRFGGDPSIIGRKIMLNAHPYAVIGVTQRGFYGPELQSRIDVQLPVSRMGDFMGGFAGGNMWKSAGFTWLRPLARLKPGVTLAQAQAAVNPLAHSIQAELADAGHRPAVAVSKTSFHVTDGSQGVNSDSAYAKPVTVLMGVVASVLLIACANLAGLLLARSQTRAKEFAVRLSLGASHWRLLRQLLVETAVLACCGGFAGLTLSYWIIRTLLAYLNAGLTNGEGLRVAMDPTVILFCIGLSLLTALLFGVAPAWKSVQPDVLPELKGAPRSVQHARVFAARRLLIVFQIALSLAILFAAGLLTRTLSRLKAIDLGFDPTHVITFRADPTMAGYTSSQASQLLDQMVNRLRQSPGIDGATLAVITPLDGSMISLDIEVPGHQAKASDLQANFNMIEAGYFKILSQPVLSGRDFDERDRGKSPRVAIVNQLFTAQYLPGLNPIGHHFKVDGRDTEIVGLVKNSRYQSLREDTCPLVYLPAQQMQSSGFTLLVKTRLTFSTASAQIESVVRAIDPKLPIYQLREMQADIDHGMSAERVLSFLSLLFSGLVILLCAMGIYGLIAYAVNRRTREIGLRIAIGARKADVAGLFLRESLALVLAGVALGIPLAFASTGILKSLLFGVALNDPVILAATIGVFLLAGLLASLLPVLRAARIEPLQALRYE